MPKELEIPEELHGSFKRLLWLVPPELRDNEEIQKTTLAFLKLGGEKLAKARIKSLTIPFSEKFILKKMQLRDDDLLEESESEENGEDVDDDDDDLDDNLDDEDELPDDLDD